MNDETEHVHEQSTSGGCLKVIGCGCLTLVLITIVAGVYLYSNWETLTRSAGANLIEFTADSMMDGFDVPEEEQLEVMAELEVFTQRIRTGELPAMESSSSLLAALAESNAAPALGYFLFVDTYITNGGLAEEEKAGAEMQVQRFLRGTIENSIPSETVDEIVDRCMKKKPDGTPADEVALRDDIQPEELREILKDMRLAADDADVPKEPYDIDLSAIVRDELDQINESFDDQGSRPPAEPVTPANDPEVEGTRGEAL